MKKLTSLLFFISKIQKKKISSDLEEKLMQKLKEKTLKKNWKNWKANLGSKTDPTRTLAQRTTHTKREKDPQPTHWVYPLGETLSLLVIPLLACY